MSIFGKNFYIELKEQLGEIRELFLENGFPDFEEFDPLLDEEFELNENQLRLIEMFKDINDIVNKNV